MDLCFSLLWYCKLLFLCSTNPYDKILTKISTPEKFSIISNQGYAWGYAGGGLLFIVNALMSIYPSSFGLASQSDAIRVSFLMVSVWWLLFLIPLLFNFQETKNAQRSKGIVLSSLKNIVTTLNLYISIKMLLFF